MNLKNYSSGQIYLPGLGLNVILNEKQYYHDDGTVSDLEKHTTEILKIFNLTEKIPPVSPFGNCLKIILEEGIEICQIYYADNPNFNPWVNPYLQAHEETHMLSYFGHLQVLDRQLIIKGYDPVPKEDEEFIAAVGGFLAVFKKRIEVNYDDIKANNYLREAYHFLRLNKD